MERHGLLAMGMQTQPGGRQRQVERCVAEKILEPVMELPEARQFLHDEETDSGIVIGRGDKIEFWHLTFQEYLAARYLEGRREKEQLPPSLKITGCMSRSGVR